MAAQPPPDLHIPASSSTVQVSIIDTTSRVNNVGTHVFLDPVIPALPILKLCPAWSFLIEHQDAKTGTKQTYLFDLGIRKDWENLPTQLVKQVRSLGWVPEISKNVSEILVENGVPLEAVDGIIWSHHHWDHTGDPSTFPGSTELVVGPGFKEHCLPTWPSDSNGKVDEKAIAGRNLREISLSEMKLTIGEYKAIDFFGDGSFYLLHSTGHTAEHLTALARTSMNPDTFMIMGGDTCHHAGALKPSEFDPLPEDIDPNPLYAPFTSGISPCPGAIFESIHPNHSTTEPFYTLPNVPDGKGVNFCRADAMESLRKLIRFEAHENVLVIFAHDSSVFGIVEVFPKRANDWKAKGWKQQHKWRFLGDFKDGLKQ